MSAIQLKICANELVTVLKAAVWQKEGFNVKVDAPIRCFWLRLILLMGERLTKTYVAGSGEEGSLR